MNGRGPGRRRQRADYRPSRPGASRRVGGLPSASPSTHTPTEVAHVLLAPPPLPRGLTDESDAPTLRGTLVYRDRDMTVASPPIRRAVCGHIRRLHGGRFHRASGDRSMPARQHQAISRFLLLTLYFFVRGIGGKRHEPDLLLVTDTEGPRCRNDYWEVLITGRGGGEPRQCRPGPYRQAHGLRRGRHPRVLVSVKRSLDIPRLGRAENMVADTSTRSNTGTAYRLALPAKNCPISNK